MMITTSVVLAFTIALAPPSGQRAELDGGATLFVPEGCKPSKEGTVDLFIHLHGTPTVVEPAFVEAGMPGVLIVFNRKGLSSVYAEPFADKTLFSRLIDDAIAHLKTLKFADDPKVGRVVLSSFSAGFGGVRAILKVPEHFQRIDGLIMADSLYCGYSGDPSQHVVDPTLMDGFRRFAIEAAAGRKTFLLTHSSQVPPGYASTTETADDLIRVTGATASKIDLDLGVEFAQTRAMLKGRFAVLGFSGVSADAHMAHLRRITELWRTFQMLRSDALSRPR